MRTLMFTVGLLLVVTSGAYAELKWSINPNPSAEKPQVVQQSCSGDSLCQHGVIDTFVGVGLTLDSTQQLGIACSSPAPDAGIVRVGFFSEFWTTPGDLDIVIFDSDTGMELSRTTVFIPGHTFPATAEYEFPVPMTVVQNACVMLCPVGGTAGATGEDSAGAPTTDSFFSQSGCTSCPLLLNPATFELTIWACWEEATVSTEEESWWSVKSLYGDER